MKKKLLLTLIPTLLALGACSGNAPEVKQQLFQEDTLLHEEVFGGISSLFGKERRNALPEDVDPSVPAVGVQKAIGETTISIRFVAATNFEKDTLENTEVVWTRTMYNANGTVLKASLNKPSLLTYTSLLDGSGDRYDIDDFNTQYSTNYKSFVVYTMLNIPKTTYDDCYLNAYLTTIPSGQAATYSSTLATNIAGTKRVSFPHDKAGYFLAGKIGVNKTVNADPETILSEVNKVSFSVDLAIGDSFLIVKNDVTNSLFEIYGFNNLDGSDYGYYFDHPEGKETITVKNNGAKFIYLRNNASSSIYFARDRYYMVGTIQGDDDSWSSREYELYESSTDGDFVLTSGNELFWKEDRVKVFAIYGGDDAWYPKSSDYLITAYGNYEMHFFPYGGSGEGEHTWSEGNCFYLDLVDTPAYETKTVNIDLSNWNPSGEKFYAWVWGGENGSSWVDITSATGTITVDKHASNIIVLRAGTDMPKGWDEGINYHNRSESLTIEDGKVLKFNDNWDKWVEGKKYSEFYWDTL